MFFTDKHALFFAHKRLGQGIMGRAFAVPTIDQLVNLHAGIGYYPDPVLDRRSEQVYHTALMWRKGVEYRNMVLRDIEAQAKHARVYLHGRGNRDERADTVKNQHFYLSARWKRKMDAARVLKLSEQELWVELNLMWSHQKRPPVRVQHPEFLPVECLEFEPWCQWQARHHGSAAHLLRAYRIKKWERIHG